MKCPYCDHPETKVLDTRTMDSGNLIRRRRECMKCGQRYFTNEKVESIPFFVIKKDGKKELFDSNKVLKGLIRACEKRGISSEELEEVSLRITRELAGRMEKEIESTEIGDMVIEELKKLDEVAYIRFVSVYRDFQNVDTFLNEIEELIKGSHKSEPGKI